MSRDTTQARIRLGMVGGGQGAFIGEVHRIAARLDDRYQLVAGALSSDSERAASSAEELRIAADRSYDNFEDMAAAESGREDGIEVVAIVTPNHLHFAVAKTMLAAGIHVICDKPLTTTLVQAQELAALIESSGLIFAVTYNYSGYPMVRQAREMIAQGKLGTIRVIQIEYAQDWLATKLEAENQKQASWRTDPAKAGAGGCIGDIGTHAFQLASFITGMEPAEILADLSAFVDGRELDDNAHILLRYSSGAKGMLWSSQVATGNENCLRIRVYGEKAGLEWAQENPNYLQFTQLGEAKQIISRGGPGTGSAANHSTRIPSGHPEGFLEAFANVYRDVADKIIARRRGETLKPESDLVPGIDAGLKGMKFIDTAVRSNAAGGVWQKYE